MTHVAIVTDSSADLAPHVAAQAGITVVPASIALGMGAVREQVGVGQTARARLSASSPEVMTMPSDAVDSFKEAFAELGRSHDEIVAVLLSSRLGDAVAAARQARERLAGSVAVEIVDSRSASLGLGFQALHAAELAQAGASAGEIAAALRAATDRYHVVFCVESVEHLRESGQVGRSAAMIAEALQLKPLLRIDEGQIVPYERVRTRARAIAELADFVREIPAVERCAVLHASTPSDAERLLQVVAAETGLSLDRLSAVEIGPVIAKQVGPGALGVAVVEADVR